MGKCAALRAAPIKLEGRQGEREDRHDESDRVEVQGHGRHNVLFGVCVVLDVDFVLV